MLTVESRSVGSDVIIWSRCACGWRSQWIHWSFSGDVHPPYMFFLVIMWQRHVCTDGY